MVVGFVGSCRVGTRQRVGSVSPMVSVREDFGAGRCRFVGLIEWYLKYVLEYLFIYKQYGFHYYSGGNSYLLPP